MKQDKIVCSHCHTENNATSNFCKGCGKPLSKQSLADDSPGLSANRCPECGAELEENADFCMECGTRVLHKRNGTNKTKGILICLICLLLIAGSGYWIYHSFFRNNHYAYGEPDLTELTKYDYVTLDSTEIYNVPGSSDIVKSLEEKQRVSVSKIAKYNTVNESWGECEDGWILIASETEEFLEPVEIKDSNAFSTIQEYIALEDLTIYANPSLLNSADGNISQGKTLHLEKVAEDQTGTIWGQIGNNKWIILHTDGEDLIALPSAESNESTEQSSSMTKKEESSSDTGTPKEQSTIVDVPETGKSQDNYSGPACAQMVLGSKGIYVAQSDLASEVGIEEGSKTDYRKLAQVLTKYLKENKINAGYTGVYLDLNEVNESKINTFLTNIDKNLNDGYPSIITIGLQLIDDSDINSYAVVYGKEVTATGENNYFIKLPKTECETYMATQDELIQLMKDAGFFCYLY